MADVKISDLTPATIVSDTDEVEINASGSSKRADVSLIRGSYTEADISAGNVTKSISAATGSGETHFARASGGDGTYTFQFTGVTNLQFPDGTDVTVANAALQGDGIIEIKDVNLGSSTYAWLVIRYEDRLVISTGEIEKHINSMDTHILDSKDDGLTTPQSFSQPKTFQTITSADLKIDSSSARLVQFGGAISSSTSTFSVQVRTIATAALDTTSVDFSARFHGTWY